MQAVRRYAARGTRGKRGCDVSPDGWRKGIRDAAGTRPRPWATGRDRLPGKKKSWGILLTSVASLPSLREIVAVVFRHKWPILLAFLLPLAVCGAAPFLMTPTYEAQARVLVKAGREFIPQGDVPGSAQASPQMTMREIVDTVTQILTSADLIRDVLREESIGKLYPAIAAMPPRSRTPEDAAIRALQRDLTVSPVRLTNVIEIRLRNADRQVAAEALRTVLARFQERHVQAFSDSRTRSLEAEIANNLRALAAVQEERASYITTRNLFSLNDQRALLVQQRVRTAQELRDTEMREAALGELIGFLRAELARQPETITLQTTTQPSVVAEEAQRRLIELRQREQELLATMTSEHPSVRAVRAALAAARQAVAQTSAQTTAVANGLNPLITTLRTQLASAEAERAPLVGRIAALKAAIEADDARLRQISADEAELRRLDARIHDLEAATSTLRQRLTDARVSDELDRARVAGISVIQHPMALDRPVSPRKILFAAAGLLLSLLSGAFALLTALTFGNRFITPDTIERILGAPVLAALPSAPPRPRRRALLGGPAAGPPRGIVSGT